MGTSSCAHTVSACTCASFSCSSKHRERRRPSGWPNLSNVHVQPQPMQKNRFCAGEPKLQTHWTCERASKKANARLGLGAITDEGDARVAATSFFNAEQQTRKTAQAVLCQTRNINPSAANDAQTVVGGVASRAGGAIEQESMGRGNQHAAGSGHMAVAADDRDACHLRFEK